MDDGLASFKWNNNKKTCIRALDSFRSKKNEPLISPEDLCDRIGLPHFSSSVIPVLEGQELSPSQRQKLSNNVIEELVYHFENNLVASFMCSKSLKSKFYMTVQNKIMEEYPNNLLEGDSQKTRKKGPLGIMISKVAERMNRRIRIQKTKRPNASSPQSDKEKDQIELDVEQDNEEQEHTTKNESKLDVVQDNEEQEQTTQNESKLDAVQDNEEQEHTPKAESEFDVESNEENMFIDVNDGLVKDTE